LPEQIISREAAIAFNNRETEREIRQKLLLLRKKELSTTLSEVLQLEAARICKHELVVRWQSASKDASTLTKESQLLRTVTWKRLYVFCSTMNLIECRPMNMLKFVVCFLFVLLAIRIKYIL
jgi:hypothetical protein